MTFRLFNRSKIRHNFFGFHYNLSQKQNTRAYNFCYHAHHTDNCMHLFQISTCSSKFFPDIRHRIDSYNIYPLICQIQKVIYHLIKYSRITIIQIPLIRIKCCHHIMTGFRKISKIPRCCCRKHLRHRLFVFLRYLFIIIKEIPAHIFPFAGSGAPRPLMIFRSMIHDKVHTYIDVFFMTLFCQLCKILHCPQIRTYLTKIRHRITSI